MALFGIEASTQLIDAHAPATVSQGTGSLLIMYLDCLTVGRFPQHCYSQSLPVTRHLQAMETFWFRKRVTIFTGDNGSGKSTLIEAIACRMGFDPGGGVQAVFEQASAWTTSTLHAAMGYHGTQPLINGYFLRSETQYDLADLHARNAQLTEIPRSHGESIMDMVEGHFFSKGLFILDEPEVGLSPVHQMALLGYIDMIARQGSQFIIATHSPIVLAVPGADIWHVTEQSLSQVDYQDHRLFLDWRAFLAQPAEAIRAEMGRLR
ncbi:AAA family ATPase [Staphylococcus chromogenes]|nr:AAA family ATPase [Staphylococcus chromogenes]